MQKEIEPTQTTKKRRSVICQECERRPVMDRCSICEDCWYAHPSFSDGMERFAAAVNEMARLERRYP